MSKSTSASTVHIEFNVSGWTLEELRASAKTQMNKRLDEVRDQGWDLVFRTGLQYIDLRVEKYLHAEYVPPFMDDDPLRAIPMRYTPGLAWKATVRREFRVTKQRITQPVQDVIE